MKKNILVFLFIIIILFVGFFCYKNYKLQKKYNLPLEKVGLKLNWLNQAEFAGNYVAVEKGFYSKEGLDVNIIPFDFKTSVVDSVMSGETSFGIIGADQLLIAREKGIPVKAIAVIYKINPATMYSLKKSGISKPIDFIGKKIGLEKGSNTVYLYNAMMNKLNINRSKIKEVSIGYDSKEILNGDIDVSTGYIINEPNFVEENGNEVNTILMSDYGVNIYSDVLFTTEDLINKNPSLINKFLSATLNGWQYAIENEKETVGLVLKYAVSSNIIHEANMLGDSIPLINTGDSELGWMNLNKWEQTYNILISQGVLSKSINIKDAFDLQFLSNFYSNKKI